jgi:hypothetical protein
VRVPEVFCRYAVNVLDRADGQVKVLEGRERLYLEFRRCHGSTGVEVGGADAFGIINVADGSTSTSYRAQSVGRHSRLGRRT